MEMEGGNSEGITGVSPLEIEQNFDSWTLDKEFWETVPVSMDYTNTKENYISSLGTSTSHHKKVDAPGSKP